MRTIFDLSDGLVTALKIRATEESKLVLDTMLASTLLAAEVRAIATGNGKGYLILNNSR